MNDVRVIRIRNKGTKPTKLAIYVDDEPTLITLKPMTTSKYEELEDLLLDINELSLNIEVLKREEKIDRATFRELEKSLLDCTREFLCLALDPIPKEYVFNIFEEDIEELVNTAICYMRYRRLDNLEEFIEENKKKLEEEKKTGN